MTQNNRNLLAQHLYWAEQGYDSETLHKAVVIIDDDPFECAKLEDVIKITGKPIDTFFKIEELQKLQYLNYKYFDFDEDLTFLEYCSNLEEIDFCCNKIQNANDLRHLKKLKILSASYAKIKSIAPLKHLKELNTISLRASQIDSLKPLLEHKKIQAISLGLLNNEQDILRILANQVNCTAHYKVKSNFKMFGYDSPIFNVTITLKEDSINIDIYATGDENSEISYTIPPPEDNYEQYLLFMELANLELEMRIKNILSFNYQEINLDRLYGINSICFEGTMEFKKIK